MRQIIILIGLIIMLSGCFCSKASININANYEKNMKQDILSLMLAYDEIIDIERDDKNKVYLVFKSGNKLIYDDKKIKNYNEKLVDPDLEDTMYLIYPLYDIVELMTENNDPGRIRSYKLLNEIYGESENSINRNLKGVNPQGNWCMFTTKNNAHKYLISALNEIKINNNKKSIDLISPINGTYCYRKISGTDRLSPHAFGIAIDVKKNSKDYWKWATREEGSKRLKEFPKDVVKAFENNYFIWGGKWAHFDILHFEYRPELIIKAKNFYSENEKTGQWYEGVVSDDKNVVRLIRLIDEKLN